MPVSYTHLDVYKRQVVLDVLWSTYTTKPLTNVCSAYPKPQIFMACKKPSAIMH